MNKTIKNLIIGIIIIVPLLWIGVATLSVVKSEKKVRNMFVAKMSERTAFYEKMWKTISQTAQVAVKNDSSFTRNVNNIMAGRKDSPGLMMKWVTESNPNANFDKVQELYKNLTAVIEASREGFFNQEKVLQDIKLQDDNILSSIPGGTILRYVFGRTYLVYKPITSDRTDDVMKTGKDNNTKVF